jgi:hypothetical protein
MLSLGWLKAQLAARPYLWLAAGVVGALAVGWMGPRLLLSSSSARLASLLVGLAGVAVAGLVLALRWRLSLYGVMVTFILVGVFVTYVPVSVTIGPLNMRPHQLWLPVVLVCLVAAGALQHAAWSRVWLAAAGVGLWGATMFWTIANLGALPSAVVSLGRVGLLAINLMTAWAMYLLVVHTGAWREASNAFVNSVAGLNLLMLVLAALVVFGIAQIGTWVAADEEPVLVNGQVVAGTTFRFAGGVVNGVLAAVALVLILVQWAYASRRRRWGLLAGASLTVAGMVVGFSRQSLVSLAGALAFLGVYLMGRGQVVRLARLVVLGAVVGGLLLVIARQWRVTQPFYQAFAARAMLLWDPAAYVSGNVGDRLSMWSLMVRDVAANPFVGAGQDRYLKYYPGQGGGGSHNYPLEVLHTTGVWGFVPYLFIHAAVGLDAWRAARRRGLIERDRWLMLGLLAVYVAMVLSSLTNLIFTNTTYWLVLGLVAGSARVVLRAGAALRREA